MSEDHLKGYAKITLERLVLAHLREAAGQLERGSEEPLFDFLAARSVHLALLTALTAAMAGTAGFGVIPEKDRIAWLAFFDGGGEAPQRDRVLSFKQLLSIARKEAVGLFQEPLTVSPENLERIDQLTFLRDCTEHPKPRWHLIEPLWMARAIMAGLDLTSTCFSHIAYRLDEEEQGASADAFRAVRVRLQERLGDASPA